MEAQAVFSSPSVADIVSLGYVSDIAVSPNGRFLVYALNGEIYTAGVTDQRRPVPRAKGSRPRWSPDSRSIAYYCATSVETLELCVLEFASGASRQLTYLPFRIIRDAGIVGSGASDLDIAWSYDSRRVAFSSKPLTAKYTANATGTIDAQGDRPLVFSGEKGRDPSINLPGVAPAMSWSGCDMPHGIEDYSSGRFCEFSQLFVIDATTGAIKQLTDDREHHFHPAWAPHGNFLWCITVRDSGRRSPRAPSDVVEIDLRTGAERVAVPGSAARILPRPSPNGKMVAFEQGASADYLPRSLVIARESGMVLLDTRSLIDRNVQEFAWTPDSQSIIISIRDGVRQRLVRLRLDSLSVTPLELGTNWVSGFSVGPGNLLVFSSEDAVNANDIYASDDGGASSRALFKLNPQTGRWRLGRQQIVRWFNSRGEQLEGVVLLPINATTNASYPLVVDMRGSNSCDCFQHDPWDANQLLAQHGYAVFYPIVRAVHNPSPTLGDKFHNSIDARQGIDRMVDDVISGINELFRRGITRPGAVAVMGFSVGAYAALQMAIHSKLFSCVIAAGPVYADWPRTYLLWSDAVGLQNRVGKTLWDDPALYRDLSILEHLQKITTPVLLLVGDHDAAAIQDVVEIYNGLRELGTPAQLVRYPNQGHQIVGESLTDYWTRVVTYLDAHLKHD
jgi:dipeptidyl aminopeptidase/acylaminoacyl peptidase